MKIRRMLTREVKIDNTSSLRSAMNQHIHYIYSVMVGRFSFSNIFKYNALSFEYIVCHLRTLAWIKDTFWFEPESNPLLNENWQCQDVLATWASPKIYV